MLDQPTQTQQPTVPRTYTRRELWVRRIMFYLGILLWVLLLSLPLSFFALSLVGEVTIPTPGDHPENRVRAWLIMEKDQRGVAYSRPLVVDRTDTRLSIQTNVRYMLWEGESDLIHYCTRYRSEATTWALTETTEGTCEP